MDIREDDIRLILGLKLRRLRQAKDYSLAELAKHTGLSVSYLNEIEKGRKYPKAEKIALLAKALGTTFDKLVSLKLDKHLAPVGELLESGFLQDVPLDLFGIDRGKLVEIIANAPAKVAAFISTLSRIAANYNMTQEHYYFAALRSYQELNENHFEDLEQEAVRFRKEFGLPDDASIDSDRSSSILASHFGYQVEERSMQDHPELSHIRSIFIPERKRLLINAQLAENQKTFLYAKELGYAFLGLGTQRILLTPWPYASSFDHVLNNSRAGYFGGALLIPPIGLVDDMRLFFAERLFNGPALLAILAKYNSSPEMFMQRLTNLVPRHLGIAGVFFQRFDHDRSDGSVEVMKELFLDRKQDPMEIEILNDAAAEWLKNGLFNELDELRAQKQYTGPRIVSQRFVGTNGQHYLIMAIGRIMGREVDRSLAVCFGLEIQASNEKLIGFLQDPAIARSRIAPRPVVAEREERSASIQKALDSLLAEELAKR